LRKTVFLINLGRELAYTTFVLLVVCFLQVARLAYSSLLKVEAATSPKMSVNCLQATQHNFLQGFNDKVISMVEKGLSLWRIKLVQYHEVRI
jgi:hypothetical protein